MKTPLTLPMKTMFSLSFLRTPIVAGGLLLCMTAPGNAANYTWDGGGSSDSSGNWSTAINWNPDVTGTSGPGLADMATLGNVTTGTRTITYDAIVSGTYTLNTLVLSQTSAATNRLVLNQNLGVTNAITLSAATGGTANITIAPQGTSQTISITTPALNVNQGGSLTAGFAAGTANVTSNLYGNLNIGGGLVTIKGPDATGLGIFMVYNDTTMTSGTIAMVTGSGGQAPRIEIKGNFTGTGGLITGGGAFVMDGSTNLIAGTTLDSGFIVSFSGVNQTLTTSANLTNVYLRGSGTKLLTGSTGTNSVNQFGFWANAGSTTTLKLGSDWTSTNGQFFGLVAASSGTTNYVVDTNGYTFKGTSTSLLTPAGGGSAGTVLKWSIINSSTTGALVAPGFNLSSTTNGETVSVGANVVLRSTMSGAANNLGGAGTIDPTSTFLYTGSTGTLTSNRTIGNLAVGSGSTSLLKITGGDLAAAGIATVANNGTLDLNAQNLSAAGLNGATGATVTNSVAGAKTLTLSGTDSYAYAGAITGNANLSKTGSGIQTLSGLNSYTGATTITGGTLVLNGSLATSAVSVGSGAILAGTGTAGGTVNATGNITGGLTFNNDVTIGSGASAAASAFNGNITNNGTISSAVNVHSGKALSGTGSVTNSVTVLSGGKTSAGNGNNTGVLTLDLTYNSGATANFNVSGSSATTSPTALKSGLSYSQVAVSGSAGTVNLQLGTGTALSQIQADGSSNSGVALELTLSVEDFAKLTSNATNNYQAGQSNTSVDNFFVFTLGSGLVDGRFQTLELTVGGIDYIGTIYYSGTNDRYNGVADLGDVIVNGQEFAVSYTGDASTNSVIGGNDIVLTAIPEPATWAMLAGGIGSLLGIQRMRRRSAITEVRVATLGNVNAARS